MFEAYVQKSVIDKAEEAFSKAAEHGLEAMGLLAGKVCAWKGKQYVLVEDFVTAKNKATAVSVKFSEEAFTDLVGKVVKQHDRIFVGWGHSHPSYGCFLSHIDVNTQRKYFPESFHVALVIDPMKPNGNGGFEKRFFKLDGNGYRDASFAVIERGEHG